MLDPPLRVGIVLAPQPDKLVQMVGAQDGPIPGQVVKVVHDDGDEQVENEEGADDEVGDEVRIRKVGSATGRVASVLGPLVADDLGILLAGQHDFLPGLAGGGAEEDQEGLRERLKVVVPVDVGALLRRDLSEYLKERER